MGQFKIEYYEKSDGTLPAEEFILSQDKKMQAKIFRQLMLLETGGNVLREPDSKFLENGIFELRTKQGNTITRILYFFVINKKIILTNGFVKKTDKTPRREIEKAIRYKDDYMQREGL